MLKELKGNNKRYKCMLNYPEEVISVPVHSYFLGRYSLVTHLKVFNHITIIYFNLLPFKFNQNICITKQRCLYLTCIHNKLILIKRIKTIYNDSIGALTENCCLLLATSCPLLSLFPLSLARLGWSL